METVIIVIHLMVIVALIAVVLLQRSEGGALGIGGGNAFLSSRGQGNVLTRATGILAAAFFATSIALSVITRLTAPPSAILDTVPATASAPTTAPGAPTGTGTTTPASPTTGGIINQLNQYLKAAPPAAAPQNGASAPSGSGAGTTPADVGSPTGTPGTAPATPQAPTSQ
jgi:preprotein translocase subunit SecG